MRPPASLGFASVVVADGHGLGKGLAPLVDVAGRADWTRRRAPRRAVGGCIWRRWTRKLLSIRAPLAPFRHGVLSLGHGGPLRRGRGNNTQAAGSQCDCGPGKGARRAPVRRSCLPCPIWRRPTSNDRGTRVAVDARPIRVEPLQTNVGVWHHVLLGHLVPSRGRGAVGPSALEEHSCPSWGESQLAADAPLV